MRRSREQTARSNERIVEEASRLFRERGISETSLADVMQAAGMTHGGFYKHFDSKEVLAERALDSAFDAFEEHVVGPGDFRSYYLSPAHVESRGLGCPVAALGSEVARGSKTLRVVFGTGLRRVLDALGRQNVAQPAARRATAIREFSMLVGALVLARASDDALREEILTACAAHERFESIAPKV